MPKKEVSEQKAPIYKPLYVIMHDGRDGPLPSIDCGNPWQRLRAARRAILCQGPIKAPIYYIVKYRAEKRISR